ncbi:MAG TPA: integrase [Syntrophomonas sp.]|jgi:site-specific recombinase XerD|nr:integrase [Syntrophomonas sp.]
MKVVSDLLGNADIRTTYNFYAHVEMEAKKEAIQGLDEKLFNTGKRISDFASR